MATNETNGISLRRLKTFLTNLKNIFAEKSHSHATSDITGLDTALSGKATSAQGAKADTAVQSVKIGTTEYKSGTTVTLPSYPTSLPASDVSDWAKQKTKPVYNASEIGLGNVGNFKAVSTVASQGLTDTEKENARTNIGAQVAGSYASASHTHDDKYQAKGSYASASHTHDDRYYTESEINTKLNGKANSSHTHGNADITAIDASKITSGTISIDRLPQGALERLTVVADDTARFKLTSTTVQKGDTVKVTVTGKMYYVVDESKLSTEDGYEVYAAGTAASVPWSGVTGKPSTYTPSSHTHTIANITNLQTILDGKAASNHTHSQYLTAHQDISGKLDNTATGADSLLSKITANWTAAPTDDTYFIRQDTGGKNEFGRVKFSTLLTYIKSKLSKVAASGDYNDLSNKPTIPSVGNGTVTITQNGTSKGTFTMNQSGNTTIALTDTNTNTWRGIQNNLTSDSTSDSLSAAQGKVLKGLVDSKVTESQNVATDLNNIKSTGIHHISASTSNNPTGTHGTLFAEFNVGTPYQIWLPDNSNTAYKRNYTTSTSTWGNWTQLKFTDTVYTHPTTSGNKHIPSGGSSGQILRWSSDGTAVWGADNNTTYSAATQSANGLMSASDKKKLDGITSGANAVIKVMSATDYSKLTDAQKKNGTIYLVN